MTSAVDPGTKENSSFSFHVPMLTTTNYTVWAIRRKVIFNVHQVWDVVDTGTTDVKRNNVATAVLFQVIPKDLVLQVGMMSTT